MFSSFRERRSSGAKFENFLIFDRAQIYCCPEEINQTKYCMHSLKLRWLVQVAVVSYNGSSKFDEFNYRSQL